MFIEHLGNQEICPSSNLDFHWACRNVSDFAIKQFDCALKHSDNSVIWPWKNEFSFNISERNKFSITISMFFEHLGKPVICPRNKLDAYWTSRKFSHLSMKQFACSLNMLGIKRFVHETIWVFIEHVGNQAVFPSNNLYVHWTVRESSDLSMKQFEFSLNI